MPEIASNKALIGVIPKNKYGIAANIPASATELLFAIVDAKNKPYNEFIKGKEDGYVLGTDDPKEFVLEVTTNKNRNLGGVYIPEGTKILLKNSETNKKGY